MSHVTTIEIEEQSYDIDALKLMCDDEGWEWRDGQRTYAWFGKHVGDYPIPEGFTVNDMGKCDHAIHIPGCNYEIGVVMRPDGQVKLIWDFWSSGGLVKALGTKAEKLKQAYRAARLKTIAKKHGRRCWEKPIDKIGWKRIIIQA